MNYALRETPGTSNNSPETFRETLPLDDAAARMGLKPDTLRKRLQTGTEDGFKGNDGRWKVYVSAFPETPESSENVREPSDDFQTDDLLLLLNEVRDRLSDKHEVIDYLKAQIAEKDKLISGLVSKLPDNNELQRQKEINKRLKFEANKNTVLLKQAFKALKAHAEKEAK
jgi:hypothetical protein